MVPFKGQHDVSPDLPAEPKRPWKDTKSVGTSTLRIVELARDVLDEVPQ
jgi:hypothetical protein